MTMDVLKDKQTRTYPYISRYASFPFYFNKADGKYMYGLTAQLDASTAYVAHKVTQTDTLESLSLKYYGRPDLYWVIADFNRIQDPFINLSSRFTVIDIPGLSSIAFE